MEAFNLDKHRFILFSLGNLHQVLSAKVKIYILSKTVALFELLNNQITVYSGRVETVNLHVCWRMSRVDAKIFCRKKWQMYKVSYEVVYF
jgi:hypothetical protein